MKLALCFATLIALSLPASAVALSLVPQDKAVALQPEPARAKRKVIDKSCLMICEKWGENDCEKWVMKCKGDPGYPNIMLKAQ